MQLAIETLQYLPTRCRGPTSQTANPKPPTGKRGRRRTAPQKIFTGMPPSPGATMPIGHRHSQVSQMRVACNGRSPPFTPLLDMSTGCTSERHSTAGTCMLRKRWCCAYCAPQLHSFSLPHGVSCIRADGRCTTPGQRPPPCWIQCPTCTCVVDSAMGLCKAKAPQASNDECGSGGL